ncbi:MAG: arginine--tRNA ligase [Oscillospiraceae bacterium]|nr:arginine--tRNA ligase [Oscillospiraceae bacterium]
MTLIKQAEKIIFNTIKELGYEITEVTLHLSEHPQYGQFQFNGVMSLAKFAKKNPVIIANEIVEKLKYEKIFKNLNVAGPGFINISFSNEALAEYVNELNNDILNNVEKPEAKKIIIDYGGPNVAKTLHVGHLRSANIGDGLKHLARLLGYEVIGDAHLGDIGRQFGILIYEIKQKYPDLVYFDEKYKGEYPDYSPVTIQELNEMYPMGSKKIKENETILAEVRKITSEIMEKPGYKALWQHIISVSIPKLKEIYDELNISFDLWEGETDAYPYILELIEILKNKNLCYENNGALIVDVAKPDDKTEIPPIIIIKSDGSYLYSTTDLGTILGRMKRFNPDEIWYVVDNRQQLHIEQVFRTAVMSGIVPENVKLEYCGFGTMNGKDGKPFKTRDGDAMKLEDLLNKVYEASLERLNENITDLAERQHLAKIIGLSALKYADLVPNRNTDYVFEIDKFCNLNGKTGPYLLYSAVRVKSLLNKAGEQKINFEKYIGPSDEVESEIIIKLLLMPKILENALNLKSLNIIAEYIYTLASSYNNFYESHIILTETDKNKRGSWLVLSKVVYEVYELILNVLGMEIPDKI